MHYEPEPSDAVKCRCTHTDKPHYMDGATCPLYKMDWQKKMRAAGLAKPRNG